jgi:PleD family two-component response regulator
MSRILFADDDEGMRLMVADVLRSAGYQVYLASDGDAALSAVRHDPPDLVLLDYRMGRPDGLEVCRQIKNDRRSEHVPVLILTGQHEVENRLLGFDAGADDYLSKPFDPRELLARVRALLRLSRQALDRNPTTGLPGVIAVEREFERWHSRGASFAVCYFDLDHFKPFADRFGFGMADEVIRMAGHTIRTATDGRDALVGHVGGDDFVVLCAAADARGIAMQTRLLFQQELARILPPDSVAAGTYRGKDREGVVRDFALTTISVAIVYVAAGAVEALADLGATVAEAKLRAKLDVSGVAETSVERTAPRGGQTISSS